MTGLRESEYVGWGGARKTVAVNLDLGVGIRRAVWDAAMGYVSGFDKLSILYYILTRSLSHRVMVWAMIREGFEFRDGVPLAHTGQASMGSSTEGNES